LFHGVPSSRAPRPCARGTGPSNGLSNSY
jgi:hypothetical protein